MKKVAKAILIALGVIAVIGAVAVLGVNIYIQSASTHARIERGLSKGLQTPVKIGSLSFMPWHGLKLSSISSRDDVAAAEGNSLEISSINLRFQPWKLLRRDVDIKELTVDGVKVSWTQNAEGKWEAPEQTAAAPAESPPETVSPAGTPPGEQPASPAEAPLPPSKAAPAPPPVTIEHARLRDASFSFFDKNHKPVATLAGVTVQTPFPTDKLVNGTAVVSSVVIQNIFHVDDWKGSFKYTPDELSLFDTSCNVAGGTAGGTLDVKISEEDSPFAWNTHFSGVSLDRLLTGAGITQLQASGTLSGFVQLEGNSRDSTATTGKGQIKLENGYIAKSDLFESLNGMLNTDKFRKLDLQQAQADFHAGEGKVFLDSLVINSAGVVSLTGQGSVELQGGGLNLKCRLAIDANIVRQIPAFLVENFSLDAASGARYVDFDITGTISRPDAKSLTRAIGKTIEKSAGNLLKKWLGGKLKIQPAATPAPPPGTPAQPAAPAP